MKKTVVDYAREADAEANLERVNDQFTAVFKTVTNSIGMELIGIPAGKFTMGSPAGEEGHQDDEVQVAVTLTKPFWLGKTEVTQGQFKNVMSAAPWFDLDNVQIDKNNAASYVTRGEATAFCQKLTDLERKAGKLKGDEEYRLPTEAEWEYACRAGTTTAYSFGEDESKMSEYAWFRGNTSPTLATVVNLDEKIAGHAGEEYPHAVGLKKPNPWGLHDMHGNVEEWCSDWYGEKLSGGTDPVGPAEERVRQPYQVEGSPRVLRGGGWGWPQDCRSAGRSLNVDGHYAPSSRNNNLSFRVARSQSAQ